VAKGLTKDVHTLWCGRSNEASDGPLVLKAILVDPGTMALEPRSLEKQLKVEFLGDSITCGHRVLTPADVKWPDKKYDRLYEDLFATWDWHLASAWKAEWSAVCKSGVALTPYPSYPKGMIGWFPCQEFINLDEKCPQWDFSKWQADVVVINMGTNDMLFIYQPQDALEQHYLTLLKEVRKKYPKALILMIVPFAYACNPYKEVITNRSEHPFPKKKVDWGMMYRAISSAVQSFNDARTLLQMTGTPEKPWVDCQKHFNGDMIHPRASGDLLLAQKLLTYLTPEVRKHFPLKCGGESINCTWSD